MPLWSKSIYKALWNRNEQAQALLQLWRKEKSILWMVFAPINAPSTLASRDDPEELSSEFHLIREEMKILHDMVQINARLKKLHI